MPLLDLTITAGSIPAERLDSLTDELAGTLLKWEGAPDNEFFRSITWVYVHELDPGCFRQGGRRGDTPAYRVEVTLPEGALSERRKLGLVESVTDLVLEAAGEGADDAALRVWCLIHEVPDGNWGAARQLIRFEQLRQAAAAGRAGDPAGTVSVSG